MPYIVVVIEGVTSGEVLELGIFVLHVSETERLKVWGPVESDSTKMMMDGWIEELGNDLEKDEMEIPSEIECVFWFL